MNYLPPPSFSFEQFRPVSAPANSPSNGDNTVWYVVSFVAGAVITGIIFYELGERRARALRLQLKKYGHVEPS